MYLRPMRRLTSEDEDDDDNDGDGGDGGEDQHAFAADHSVNYCPFRHPIVE